MVDRRPPPAPADPETAEERAFDGEDAPSAVFGNPDVAGRQSPALAQPWLDSTAVRELRASHTGTRPAMHVLQAQEMLAKRVGHAFARPELLEIALCHPSWRNEQPSVPVDNQRLEFLGDLVVGLVIGEALLRWLPNGAEGDLSLLRQELVRERALAQVAEDIGVGPALRLGKGDELRGAQRQPSVLADTLEAIFGATFLDAGYTAAQTVVMRLLGARMDELVARYRKGRFHSPTAAFASTENYKTALQVLLSRARCAPPIYTVVAEVGTPQQPRFRVQVTALVHGLNHAATGEGSSKKNAEAEAAHVLFNRLRAQLMPAA